MGLAISGFWRFPRTALRASALASQPMEKSLSLSPNGNYGVLMMVPLSGVVQRACGSL